MKKIIAVIILIVICLTLMGNSGCEYDGTTQDTLNTISMAAKLQSNQPTPTDINYSLERYNLIKRAYWVNGQREKALSLPCAIDRPLGYIILLTESGAILGSFVVDGKVSSLNSYLTPDSEFYEGDGYIHYGDSSANEWLADIDGSYGENDNGIFFFTTDGKYLEYTGIYLYSDIPFEVSNPVIRVVSE